MDAWKNARAIEEIREDIKKMKQHIVRVTELILKSESSKKSGWFNRDKDGDKNETVQSKQHKS